MTESFGGFYGGRRVLVTGHSGFKGSWLALWLRHLGADVYGFSDLVPTHPSHFAACRLFDDISDERGDIRDFDCLAAAVQRARPEVVFHLAAQPIVRRAYLAPRETFEVNVMGTVNLLEAARRESTVRAVVVVTSDKAYLNDEAGTPFRETDRLGGHEAYAGSKACAELVTEVYRQSAFQAHAAPPSAVAVASARAGNVIGGGDWAVDRLVPDIVRAIVSGRDIVLRHPDATRPWQHVLDCLAGYLQLARRLTDAPAPTSGAWNFGPAETDALPVAGLVRQVLARWPNHASGLVVELGAAGKESKTLRVDSSRAMASLGWRPVWTAQEAIQATVDWYVKHGEAAGGSLRETSLHDIAAYTAAARGVGAEWAVA